MIKTKNKDCGPFLKWAGGKTQLLVELEKLAPLEYDRYVEPFLGGGALFFHLQPKKAILADTNEELINCYRVVRDKVEELIEELKHYKNDEKFYYRIREKNLNLLTPIERAARLIYLNKTCYNGLYRVNKKGLFNVPFGRRKNPKLCDADKLRQASKALQKAKLVCDDYKNVIKHYVNEKDFIFFDPPYYPTGGHADFKRYTKEFFYEKNHVELRDVFGDLAKRRINSLLTNSNTEFVRKLFEKFDYKVVDVKRNISSKASTRNGQDVIVCSNGQLAKTPSYLSPKTNQFIKKFPGTRYMGSKYRVLSFIWENLKHLKFKTVLDAFSGSNCVSYMFKEKGKEIYSNDFMRFSYQFSLALIENNKYKLNEKDLKIVLDEKVKTDNFISNTFRGLYFKDEENLFLDKIRANIEKLDNKYKKALALSALSRACLKRRPRGIFTYTGERYNDGRRDMKLSLREHFLENVKAFNGAVFDNASNNRAFNKDIFDLDVKADLVYFDPPYYTPNSDNDYSRRYHFVEGLARQWKGLEIQEHTTTKKFKRYETPFYSKNTIYDAFDRLFKKFSKSIIVVSYSSNSLPDRSSLIKMLENYKSKVNVYQIQHLYSCGNQNHKIGNNANRVLEYVFVAQ